MAVHYEHPPAWAPYTPYSNGWGKSLEGLAAVRSPVGVTSLPKLAFSDLIDRVRVYESSMGVVPDSFLDSLHSFVLYLTSSVWRFVGRFHPLFLSVSAGSACSSSGYVPGRR